jgi:arylsulfatase A-like enzyme
MICEVLQRAVRGRRKIVAAATIGVLTLFGTDPRQAAALGPRRPNIVFILTDNTGWGDWGPYGGGVMRGAASPNVDRLAAEGMRLENFNTEPQCTPSRSAIMTGRFAVRSGTQSIPIGTNLYGLVPWEITIADSLSTAGYATAAFGKWHLGQTAGRFPTDHGFDQWYGIPNTSDESTWLSPEVEQVNSIPADIHIAPEREPYILASGRGEIPHRVKLYDIEARKTIDRDLTQQAVSYIAQHAQERQPFFVYLALTATHYPSVPSREFAGSSGHGDYADMLVQTDFYLGQVMNALKAAKVDQDTIVVFCSDNGAEDPAVGNGQYNGWTGPWRGSYFTAMEGGLRAPFIIRWPGHVPQGAVSNKIVHDADIFSTLADWAGAKVPDDRPIDGIDMVKFFQGQSLESGRDGFPVFVGNDLRAVKWRDWKWHLAWQVFKTDPVQPFSTAPRVIDLTRDPREERYATEPYNTWLQFPVTQLIADFRNSVARFPNVPVGAPDTYRPQPSVAK